MLWKIGNNRELSLFLFICLLLFVFAVTTPSMLAPGNVVDLLHNTVVICILTLGAIIVIIARGIDLSIGAIMGFVTLLVGKLAIAGWPLWAIILAGMMAGIIAGCVNGALVTLTKLPPIIATLGTLSIYSGAMYMVTEGQWVTNLPDSLLILGSFQILGVIPGRMAIMALILIGTILFLQVSVKGRHIYAVGNNPIATRLAGIKEKRVVFQTYVIAGLLSAIAGILYISYTGFSTPTTGIDMQLKAIAAAVIGGASVFGGRGTPFGGLLGSFLLVIIASSLVYYHLPAIWNQAAEGAIILIAVIVDSILAKQSSKKAEVV